MRPSSRLGLPKPLKREEINSVYFVSLLKQLDALYQRPKRVKGGGPAFARKRRLRLSKPTTNYLRSIISKVSLAGIHGACAQAAAVDPKN
jgi:hypothetical protein